VNEPADIARALDMGVDGIISDYPDRVMLELKRRTR
jgi:glycerophosphoryl diester phosphodiesterase